MSKHLHRGQSSTEHMPPPPPPDVAALDQAAATAYAAMVALETDPAAPSDALWYAFDAAFVTARAAYRAQQAPAIAAKWAGVRAVMGVGQ